MYSFILGIHNILRWGVILSGVISLLQAYSGFLGNRRWGERDHQLGIIFASLLDLQLLIGFVLYFFLSDITRLIFTDFSTAISGGFTRFFSVDHAILMLLAVIFTHLGTILPRRVDQSKIKYAHASIWFTLAFLMLMLGIPWIRPLFPNLF